MSILSLEKELQLILPKFRFWKNAPLLELSIGSYEWGLDICKLWFIEICRDSGSGLDYFLFQLSKTGSDKHSELQIEFGLAC